MARSYGVCLGLIAFVICIARGLLMSDSSDAIVIRSIGMMLAFAPLGFILGWITEELVRQSVEKNFRRAVEKAEEKQTS
jgi:cytochrome bd-type quinol oxidase subunit 1